MSTWEEKFNNWSKPPSNTEEVKLENARRIISETIRNSELFKYRNIDFFGQGSYANNTNIRLNSDIDINICYKEVFFYDIPNNLKKEDFGLTNSSTYTFKEYKNQIESVLVAKFGRSNVIRKNKCIKINGNSYRVECDVVPTFQYRGYKENGSYNEGTKLESDNLDFVVNYPKQHIQNGNKKNSNTLRRFKRSVRVLKRLKVEMVENKENIPESISSFLIESLIWNVPDYIFNNYNNWYDRIKEIIRYLYLNTLDDTKCKEWGEVSELFYLFHSNRKWERSDVNSFILKCWHYIGYTND